MFWPRRRPPPPPPPTTYKLIPGRPRHGRSQTLHRSLVLEQHVDRFRYHGVDAEAEENLGGAGDGLDVHLASRLGQQAQDRPQARPVPLRVGIVYGGHQPQAIRQLGALPPRVQLPEELADLVLIAQPARLVRAEGQDGSVLLPQGVGGLVGVFVVVFVVVLVGLVARSFVLGL